MFTDNIISDYTIILKASIGTYIDAWMIKTKSSENNVFQVYF